MRDKIVGESEQTLHQIANRHVWIIGTDHLPGGERARRQRDRARRCCGQHPRRGWVRASLSCWFGLRGLEQKLIVIMIVSLLSACGGGGGGSSNAAAAPQPTAPAPSAGPTVTDGCETRDNIIEGNVLACTLNHDGLVREYLIFIPDSYRGDVPVPLLLYFHGYTGTANNALRTIDFRSLAEQNTFILVVPQGTLLPGTGEPHWAVGGWSASSTTDDVGFTDALLDRLAADYVIDSARIYSTGMSNGGAMSYHLACQLSDRIAAIASVTGSFTRDVHAACNPMHATPIMHIHGTADTIVPFDGDNERLPIDEIMDFWSQYNVCDIEPTTTPLDDTNGDGNSGDLITYSNCQTGVEVQLYKMTGMGHTWPELAEEDQFGRDEDISATQVVWQFLSRFSLDGEG
ncbi:MAG: PHB depolymerase family esterase [Pseudomonadales bacterium]